MILLYRQVAVNEHISTKSRDFNKSINLKFVKNVVKNVEKLSSHLKAYKVFHEKLGNQLGIAVGHYNNTTKEFKKINKDIIKISGNSSIDLGSDSVEKPQLED